MGKKNKKHTIILNRRVRTETAHNVFGQPCPLPESSIPTYIDVGRAILYVQEQKSKGQQKNSKQVPFSEIRNKVAEDVSLLWDKASLNHVNMKSIRDRIDGLWEKKRKMDRHNSAEDVKILTENWSKLFDISRCKCERKDCEVVGCTVEECKEIHLECSCLKANKINKRELEFLFDQRGPRLSYIFGIDTVVTAQLQDRFEKMQKTEAFFEKEKKRKIDLEEQEKEAKKFLEDDDFDTAGPSH